ncbi:MAG: response regulator [Candidatus Aenigmatarchaeota archaeon]
MTDDKIMIYVGDDDGDNRRFVKAVIGMTAYPIEVYEFPLPRTLIDFARENRPDIVLTDFDYKVADGNGLTISAKMKRMYPDVTVCILSGSNLTDRELCDHGVDKFIKKPFSINELKDYLEGVMKEIMTR